MFCVISLKLSEVPLVPHDYSQQVMVLLLYTLNTVLLENFLHTITCYFTFTTNNILPPALTFLGCKRSTKTIPNNASSDSEIESPWYPEEASQRSNSETLIRF